MGHTIKKLSIIISLWRAINDLIGHRGIRNEIPLPNKIGNFKLAKPILEDKKNNKFQYGIYRDTEGKEYIAKQLSLKNPGIDEYWLRNEMGVYSSLTNLYEQKGNIIKKMFPDIYIPKLVGIIDDQTRLVLLTEKISGKTLFDIPMNERIKHIEEAIQYFRFLNTIHDFKKEAPTQRRPAKLLILLSLAFVGALKNHPDQWNKILRGLKEIFSNLAFILNQKDMKLIHRDIGYSNILLSDSGAKYVIDFELSSYMHPMWEVVQIVVGCWKREGFNEAFSKSEEMANILNDNDLRKIYKLFSIYSGIHLLATHGKNVPKDKAEASKKYLDYALSF